jgi:hypothetical protein
MHAVTFNRAYPITKSDTVNIVLPNNAVMGGIWVGGAGIVLAIYDDDSQAAFTCVAGTVLPISCKRVQSTTTTATLMVALYSV